MRSAQNRVVAGKYNETSLYTFGGWRLPISKDTVDHYEVLDQESAKSMSSALTRGIVGGALLGPVGIAAAVTAKIKNIYTVVVYYKDSDKKCMLEMDDKTYRLFLNRCFDGNFPAATVPSSAPIASRGILKKFRLPLVSQASPWSELLVAR